MGETTPREQTADELKGLLIKIIDGSSGALPAQLIRAALRERGGQNVPPRTLRRHLAALTRAGRIAASGTGRGRTYRTALTHVGDHAALPTTPEGHTPSLSAEGKAALRLVRRPVQLRTPVGYRAELLAEYRPGETWYLSAQQRSSLAQVGTTPEAGQPAGTFARDIYGRLLIDLAWASSRLEGNTYTRLDTENLLEFGQRAEGKDAEETQMILNHKRAIELLVEDAAAVELDRRTVLALHAALSENLLPDTRDEGRLRTRPVGIGGSTYTPLAIPQKIEEHFDLILTKARAIPDAFEQSFFVMVHIPYLQPFADVNKRTSRLAANVPFITANLCPLSFIDVTPEDYVAGVLAVYENQDVSLLRDLYLWAYTRSSAQYRIVRDSIGEPEPLRLRYREQLAAVIRDTIRALEPPSPRRLSERLSEQGVTESDIDRATDIAQEILMGLSEGAAARYRLLPSEYQGWRDHVALDVRPTRHPE